MQKIHSVDTNERSDFLKLWQQHKQLKTIKMNEARPDIYEEGYIHKFQPGTLSQNSVAAKKAPRLKIFSQRISLRSSQRPSQSARDIHELCNEKGHPILSFQKSQ